MVGHAGFTRREAIEAVLSFAFFCETPTICRASLTRRPYQIQSSGSASLVHSFGELLSPSCLLTFLASPRSQRSFSFSDNTFFPIKNQLCVLFCFQNGFRTLGPSCARHEVEKRPPSVGDRTKSHKAFRRGPKDAGQWRCVARQRPKVGHGEGFFRRRRRNREHRKMYLMLVRSTTGIVIPGSRTVRRFSSARSVPIPKSSAMATSEQRLLGCEQWPRASRHWMDVGVISL